MGSSQGRLRSLGIESMREFAWACLSSRRSFASCPWVRAARFMDPSGLATILTGESSLVMRVCPLRKAGSSSFNSISSSSSVSSKAPRMPFPDSASNMGYWLTGSTPEAMSCRASQSSGDDSFLPWGLASSSAIFSLRAPRFRPRLISVLPDGASTDRRRSSAIFARPSLDRAGMRSCPVRWSTSFMDRDIFVPAMEMIFTLTRWLRDTSFDGSVTMPLRMWDTCTSPSLCSRRPPDTPSSSTKTPKFMILVTRPL
mmetsp:Transcript_20155/g.58948  ORF Transcript_20155/g.58948 Transcript_20155/m.58948 type:complete len:256 (-) Transcript_20155:68-835(-)